MLLIELFVPKGALTEERRRRVSQRLLAELTHAEGAPPAVVDAGRALWQVVVHEPDAWIAGGRPVEPAQPPRYFVRMSVPSDGSSLTDEVRAGYVATITRVLAEADENPQRLYRDPVVSVHILDVPEGSFGTLGRAMRHADLIRMVMGAAGTTPHAAKPVAPGSDTAIDPICGMTVALTETAVTLERDGATYAFCSSGCRELFAEQLAGSAQ